MMKNKKENRLNPISTDFCTLDNECAYLPGKNTRMFYKYTYNANKEFVTEVIKRGWRRFGKYYFYPICNGCNECKSLRIDVNNFTPSRSQKRVIKRNKDTEVVIQKTSVDTKYVKLYNKYHKWKSKKDGWKHKDITTFEYFENFVEGAHDFGYEVLYYIDKKLVGVDLIDETNDGISSIYFFYDPDYAKYSLGTFSLLMQIEWAKSLGLSYIYLGYWVDGCKAFAYKPNFKPEEILDGFPKMDEEPNWVEFKAPKSNTD